MAEETPLLIYGNGAIARLVHSFVRRVRPVAAFTVDDAVMGDARELCGLPLLPFSEIARTAPPSAHEMLIAVGYRDMNALRLAKCAEAKAKGYRLASYIHPDLFAHDDVRMGENTIVLDHVSIHPGCRLGDGVFISSNVNLGHDCTLSDGVWINSGVSLAGGCSVGAGAFFGVNASAAHGVAIGAHAYISANTFVDKEMREGDVLLSPGGRPFRLKSHDFLRFSARA